ncbi:MAG: mechanosensitive ion channel [Burkholderiales bacterium]|nr:mechanosensitive ion channel [Burkholderiales bacterium]
MNQLMRDWNELSPWVAIAVASVVGVLLAWVVYRVIDKVVQRLAPRTRFIGPVTRAARRPAAWFLPLLVLNVVVQNAPDDLRGIGSLRQALTVAVIGVATWLLVRIVSGLGDAVVALKPIDVADNLMARRLATQTKVVTRTVMSLLTLIGLAMALMTFPSVRQIGAGLLASAGVAGIAAGLAARPILGNLLAGLQIAFTQPIRLDDVVIVQGEWGRVEEITGTYVVLKIWDERRLIVPLQWWIENPFQNWTRNSAQIMGTVMVWLDYRTPVAPLREAVERIVKASPLWDGRVCVIQVTDFTERTMQIRVLVSSADSGKNFDLRCLIREEIMALMQRDYPDYLPRERIEVDSLAAAQDRTEPDVPRAPVEQQRSPTPELEQPGTPGAPPQPSRPATP